jgi:hypothetical protein
LAGVLFAAVGVFIAAYRLPEIFFHLGRAAGEPRSVEENP